VENELLMETRRLTDRPTWRS